MSRWPRWRALAFVVYALATVTATHWPKLRIDSAVIDRPDIVIHVVVFGGWTIALLVSGFVRARSRPIQATRGWLIAAAYAGVDELTQQLPGVYRTACWDDYAANVVGVTLGAAAWFVATRWLERRRSWAASPS